MMAMKKGLYAAIALVAVLGTTLWVWVMQPLESSATAPTVLVEIPRGSSVADIARILRNKGIVRRRKAFAAAVLLSGSYGRLKAGWYELSAGMSPLSIARKIAAGKVVWAQVTIPEGSTLRQIAQALEKIKICSAADFIAAAVPATVAARPTSFSIPGRTLEGYLFPDTYVFALGTPAKQVVTAMVDQFEQAFVLPTMGTEVPAELGGLHGVVTLASLVEREAKWPEEKPLIAGVLLNRLKLGMPLQCDATVQYALGEHKPRLTYEDLQVESPYNTYLHRGLPPGPICSPGLGSLRAALQPQKTTFMYYVAKPDGHHVFSRTYQEHKAAIARIRGSQP